VVIGLSEMTYITTRTRVRIERGDTYETLSYFQGKTDGDSSFFSEFSFVDDGRLQNIFWADAISRFDLATWLLLTRLIERIGMTNYLSFFLDITIMEKQQFLLLR
jgi:hypothetical protein